MIQPTPAMMYMILIKNTKWHMSLMDDNPAQPITDKEAENVVLLLGNFK